MKAPFLIARLQEAETGASPAKTRRCLQACAEIYNDSRKRNEQPDMTSQSMEHLRKQPSP